MTREDMATAIERTKQKQKARQCPKYNHLNNMTLVSKQFGSEFLSTYLIHARPVFTLDASSTDHENPLGISKESLRRIKHCTLKILATPGIANAFDPREAEVRNWELRDAIFASMQQMTQLKSMTLSIQACGNQLWNPLWLWHFTSQAFKESDMRAFKRIDFTMKGWNLREPNHLQRTNGEAWEWLCRYDHFVMKDETGVQPVRKFCSSLYRECKVCEHGEYADSGDEEDSADEEI
jgi:hypothetical protein